MAQILLTYLSSNRTQINKTNNMEERQSSFSFKWILYGIVGLFVLYSAFFSKSDGSSGTDYVEETLEEPTQGILVELQEQEKDLFKITNEEILENRADSRIIANYMDNTSDTFTLEEVKLMQADERNPRRSLLRTAAYAGMFGYMMGRPMSSGVNRSAYANDKAYNKSSNAGRSQLRSTASKTVTRRPSSSKGYGGGKSSRSYGG